MGLVPAGLLMQLTAGPWIRHYSFSGLVVLNAHLQAALSLGDYAEITADPDATALAARMRQTAAAMIPRFDTGYWTHYSLGREAPLRYHVYVIQILRRLALRTGEEFWRTANFMGSTANARTTGLPSGTATGRPLSAPRGQVPRCRARPFLGLEDLACDAAAGRQVQTVWFAHGWHTLTLEPRAASAGHVQGRSDCCRSRRQRRSADA